MEKNRTDKSHNEYVVGTPDSSSIGKDFWTNENYKSHLNAEDEHASLEVCSYLINVNI